MSGKASPEAMDRMIATITKFIQVQERVIQSLKNDYIAVGEEWNDKQYQNLESVINEVTTALCANNVPLSECVTKLQVLKQILEHYLEKQW